MPPTPRAALLSLALAAACKGEPYAPPGPPYTPATADMLKALAADCQIKPGPQEGSEVRDCRGRQATVKIDIDPQHRIRELDMMVLASTGVDEAWVLYNNVLPATVGPVVTDVARRRLHGEQVEDAGGARVSTIIDGQKYMVKITWGR